MFYEDGNCWFSWSSNLWEETVTQSPRREPEIPARARNQDANSTRTGRPMHWPRERTFRRVP